jgi:ATP synthase protein I
MADPEPPTDSLSSLRARVASARGKQEGEEGKPPQSAASLAMRMGGEFGAAILVGALVGYGADYLLHSAPWGLVIGLGLGFATGIVNVTRAAAAYSAQASKDGENK